MFSRTCEPEGRGYGTLVVPRPVQLQSRRPLVAPHRHRRPVDAGVGADYDHHHQAVAHPHVEGEIATVHVDGDAVPAECRTGTFRILVLRLGAATVGPANLPLQDDCMGSRADMALPLPRVGE